MQVGVPAPVFRLHIRADLQEDLHHVDLALLTRPMQGCHPPGIAFVEIVPEVRQQLHQAS